MQTSNEQEGIEAIALLIQLTSLTLAVAVTSFVSGLLDLFTLIASRSVLCFLLLCLPEQTLHAVLQKLHTFKPQFSIECQLAKSDLSHTHHGPKSSSRQAGTTECRCGSQRTTTV